MSDYPGNVYNFGETTAGRHSLEMATLQALLQCITTIGPVIIEIFRFEIGQFKISSDKFANDSVQFKKVQPKLVVAIQKPMLNLKKSTAIQSKSS